MRTALFLFLSLLLISSVAAQTNCSVNAGSPELYCKGEKIKLRGAISGQFEISTIKWELISSPPGSNIEIDNTNSINAKTNVVTIAGDYTFRLTLSCEVGDASQSVTHTVNPTGEGLLIFPDLNCHPEGDPFWVQKIITPGNFFLYDFELDSKFKIIEQQADSMRIEIRSCITEEFYYPQYRVSNQHGCSETKVDTMLSIIDYQPIIEIIITEGDECGNLIGYCPSVGQPLWTITSAPPGSIATLSTPNNRNTQVCDLTEGGFYTFSYDVLDPPCTDNPAIAIEGSPDSLDCPSALVNFERFCPGEIPANAVISFPIDIDPLEQIIWIQSEGPMVTLIGTDKEELTISGLASGNYYNFILSVFNPINDCTVLHNYSLYEENIDPDITFLIRDESFQFCPATQSCNNQYVFNDRNLNNYFDVEMKLELVSYPPEANITEPFIVIFDTPGNSNVPLEFSNINRVNNFLFENIRLSRDIGGQLRFNLCSETAPGNYLFKLTLINACFEYEESLILRTNAALNNILPNAGTDQVLPCFQDSTVLAGNEMGANNEIVLGFWTTILHPENSDNPTPSLIQDQFLTLKDLSVGLYTFRYFAFYNELNSSQNPCKSENRYDDVSVIVSGNNIENIAIVPDQLFCSSNEYCLTLPIDDSGSSTSIEQINGPSTTIPAIQFGGVVCFTQLEAGESYTFNYLIDNGCSVYEQEFEIEIASSAISPAIILNQDTCVAGNAPMTHSLMAQAVTDGTGEWTYVGEGTASFSPSVSSANVVATISNGINYPIYREFIWTVTNDLCEDVNQDKFVFKNNGFVPIDIEPLFIDCNASFPYTLELSPGGAFEGTEVQWTLLTSSSDELPIIQDAQSDSTAIDFLSSGTFIFELKYSFEGDCGENEEVALIEVRLSDSDAVAYAGQDIYQCENHFEIQAFDPGNLLGFWSIEQTEPLGLAIEIEDPEDFQTVVTFLQEGNAILQWNLLANDPSCGIISQDDIFLSWQEFNLFSNSETLCQESLVIIEHSPIDDEDIEWSLMEGPSSDYFIAPISGSSTLFSNLEEGIYEFEYQYTTPNSDCSSSGIVQITVLGIGEINVEKSFCEIENNTLENLSLDVNISDFQLSEVMLQDKPAGSLDGLSPIINFDGISFSYNGFDVSGSYVFEMVGSSNTCFVSAYLTIFIGALPISNLPSSFSFCQGESTFLNPSADPSLFYQWSPSNLVNDPNLPNPQFIGNEDAIITVLISGSSDFQECLIEKDLSIGFSDIDASISPDQVLCEWEEITVEVFGDDNILQIEWLDENDNFLGNGRILILNPTDEMLVTAIVSNASGCELILSTIVEISPLIEGIVANANPSMVELGESTQLNVISNWGLLNDCEIAWTPSDQLDNPNIQNPIASPTSTQGFEVAISKDGCISRDFIEVEVDNSCLNKEYFIPNMFTPNGDGHNDCFQVYGDIDNFELFIFDRWGEEIILITETDDCWDGSYKSQDLPPDVYAYYVKHIRCDGKEIVYKGNVTLIK